MSRTANLQETKDSFLRDGYIINGVENREVLDQIRDDCLRLARTSLERLDDLALLHHHIGKDSINELRMLLYSELNGPENEFIESLYRLASDHVDEIAGNELAAQCKVNVSIQMPGDDGSQLKLHSDTMSGESEYEIVVWVPLTDVEASSSMYVMDTDTSRDMFMRLSEYHLSGMDRLYEDYKDKAQFLKVSYGEFVLFTPTLFHGSIVNQTERTRVSINARFKGLFTPYSTDGKSEKRLGSFYRPFRVRPATLVGMRHREPRFGQ